ASFGDGLHALGGGDAAHPRRRGRARLAGPLAFGAEARQRRGVESVRRRSRAWRISLAHRARFAEASRAARAARALRLHGRASADSAAERLRAIRARRLGQGRLVVKVVNAAPLAVRAGASWRA